MTIHEQVKDKDGKKVGFASETADHLIAAYVRTGIGIYNSLGVFGTLKEAVKKIKQVGRQVVLLEKELAQFEAEWQGQKQSQLRATRIQEKQIIATEMARTARKITHRRRKLENIGGK